VRRFDKLSVNGLFFLKAKSYESYPLASSRSG